MCLVVVEGYCGSGYVGGIFCGEIEFQGFQGRVPIGWWVGWVMVFVYLGLLFCGVWLGFLVFDVVNDGDGNVEV